MYLKILFEALGYEEDKLVVAYQSCQVLNTIASDTNLIKIFDALKIDIIEEVVIKNIQTTKVSLFFKFLSNFIINYHYNINERILDIIKGLIQR